MGHNKKKPKIKTKKVKEMIDKGVGTELQFDVYKSIEENKKVKPKDIFEGYKETKKTKPQKKKKSY
mgnify:FL=1